MAKYIPEDGTVAINDGRIPAYRFVNLNRDGGVGGTDTDALFDWVK